jgi:hypothetical protein
MGWLDKLLGREKKAADETPGEMKREGMGEEQAAPSTGMPSSPEPPAREEEQQQQQPPPGSP